MEELQTALLHALADRFATVGFKATLRDQRFHQPFKGGKRRVHVAFIRHDDDFDVTCDVAVRLDALEHLLKSSTKVSSLGAELGNLAGTGQRRWKVGTAKDVEPVADGIFSAFKEIGAPVLEQTSSLQGAFDALTRPGRAGWVLGPVDHLRAKRVVGLAKLLQKNSELPSIIKSYEELLAPRNDWPLANFRQFVETLQDERRPTNSKVRYGRVTGISGRVTGISLVGQRRLTRHPKLISNLT